MKCFFVRGSLKRTVFAPSALRALYELVDKHSLDMSISLWGSFISLKSFTKETNKKKLPFKSTTLMVPELSTSFCLHCCCICFQFLKIVFFTMFSAISAFTIGVDILVYDLDIAPPRGISSCIWKQIQLLHPSHILFQSHLPQTLPAA